MYVAQIVIIYNFLLKICIRNTALKTILHICKIKLYHYNVFGVIWELNHWNVFFVCKGLYVFVLFP